MFSETFDALHSSLHVFLHTVKFAVTVTASCCICTVGKALMDNEVLQRSSSCLIKSLWNRTIIYLVMLLLVDI